VHTGDAIKVETESGSVVVPAYVWHGIRKDAIAIPLGQGHTAYGRYAENRGVNAVRLLAPVQDQAAGSVAYLASRAKVTKVPDTVQLVRTQRHREQADREIAQIVPVAALLGAAAGGGEEGEV